MSAANYPCIVGLFLLLATVPVPGLVYGNCLVPAPDNWADTVSWALPRSQFGAAVWGTVRG